MSQKQKGEWAPADLVCKGPRTPNSLVSDGVKPSQDTGTNLLRTQWLAQSCCPNSVPGSRVLLGPHAPCDPGLCLDSASFLLISRLLGALLLFSTSDSRLGVARVLGPSELPPLGQPTNVAVPKHDLSLLPSGAAPLHLRPGGGIQKGQVGNHQSPLAT